MTTPFDKTTTFEFEIAAPLSGERGYPRAGVNASFDFVLGKLPGECEGAFAAGSIHVIAGPSGSGKTTLALPILIDQRARRPVFGRETYGKSFIAIMGDRGEGETARTMARMKIKPDFPIVHITGNQHKMSIAPLLEELYLANGRPEIVFLEGLDVLMRNQLKMDSAAPNLAHIRAVATHYHFSLITTAGSPKQRGKDQYDEGSRDQIFGSIAFSRMSDTILVVKKDDKTGRTITHFQFRNSKSLRQEMGWQDGRLVMFNAPPPEPDRFAGWVMEQTEPFTTEAAAKANKVSIKVCRRKLQGMNLTHKQKGLSKVWSVSRVD